MARYENRSQSCGNLEPPGLQAASERLVLIKLRALAGLEHGHRNGEAASPAKAAYVRQSASFHGWRELGAVTAGPLYPSIKSGPKT